MNYLELIKNKIFTQEQFSNMLSIWRFKEDKLVFTNGCFDITHLGHVDYLAKAADLGTKLIIGLNTDASTRRIKGINRPINNQDSRAHILASFVFVDAVIFFDEDTPEKLINYIKPHVLVKGADYQIENIVGAQEVLAGGGEVKTISFIEGYSTTAIERRIINANMK